MSFPTESPSDSQPDLYRFAKNKGQAAAEIKNQQTIYNQKKAAGASPDELNKIHSWAESIRKIAGLPAYAEPKPQPQIVPLPYVPVVDPGPNPANTINMNPTAVQTATPLINSYLVNPNTVPSYNPNANSNPNANPGRNFNPNPNANPSAGAGPNFNPNTTPVAGGVGDYTHNIRNEFEAQGFQVGWDPKTQSVLVRDPKTGLQHSIGSDKYKMNSKDQRAYANQQTIDDAIKALGLGRDPESIATSVVGRMGDQINGMPSTEQVLEQSRVQAIKDIEAKKATSATMLEQLKKNLQLGTDQINNNLKAGEQNITENSFQQYLAARQAMTARGLSGSGLAQDQDTRLLMSKNRDMSKLYADAQTSIAGMQNRFQGDSTKIQQDMAALDPETLARKYADATNKDNMKFMTDAGTFINNNAKHSTMSAKDKATLDFNYSKLDATTQNNISKYNIDIMKIMAVGPDGQPTLDRQKLNETIRHHQVSEQVSAAAVQTKFQLGSAKLIQDGAQFNATMTQKGNELGLKYAQLDRMIGKDKMTTIKNVADSAMSRMTRAMSILSAAVPPTGDALKRWQAEYDLALEDVTNAEALMNYTINIGDGNGLTQQDIEELGKVIAQEKPNPVDKSPANKDKPPKALPRAFGSLDANTFFGKLWGAMDQSGVFHLPATN